MPRVSQYFRRQRDDLHELRRAQLACHRSEDTCTDGLELRVQQHRRITVEANHRTVSTAHAEPRAYDNCVVHLAFLDLAAWNRIPNADLDDIANRGVATLGTAQHLDAHQ